MSRSSALAVPVLPLPTTASATFLRRLAAMHRFEAAHPDEVAARQAAMAARVLAHATARSAFWAERAGGRADLAALPVLTRMELERQVAAEGPLLAAHGAGRVGQGASSGSSGRAVRFHVDAAAAAFGLERTALDALHQGLDPRKRLAISKHSRRRRELGRWPNLLGRFLKTGTATATNHTKVDNEALAAWLAASDAAYLIAPPPALDRLLPLWQRRPDLVPRLERIVTFGFDLPPALRATVQAHTGARIADRYSANEVGPIAFQCPAADDRYHVATSNVMVEVVDDAGRPVAPGRLGRVLVTNLHNLATPFLRYELGDLAALGAGCPCGHAGPTLAVLAGRDLSLLRLPDGERRSFHFCAVEWLAAAPVREYRVDQVAPRRLEAEVVAPAPLDAEDLGRLRAMLAARCPADFEVAVRQVPAIAWGPGYKRLEFRCLVR